ncbi:MULTISPECIES: GNAT family N-acetyltransferase [Halococcus]|uniref:N-acetyltransferase GCN5 n=1 Tax=Halococcus salifodinae DSM 8989 TaxID=1227456 RepID=M0NED5_9EURY|nr:MULTISPECIES: GNAT family N-acetyltransferase [Halococcus]EMA55449.1 N-acetyltransferase GCN5 [Halococcus salifodinae DSM 8989]
MSATTEPETFDDDVRRRLYEYVERNGAVRPEVLRNEVRVAEDRPGSKPPRSALPTKRVRLPAAQFREHVDALIEAGHLDEHDGKLRVAWEAETTELDTADGPVTIRPAHQEDMEGITDVIGRVTAAGTHIRAETVGEAIDRESALLRHDDRRRTFFVATEREDAGETDTADTDETDQDGGGEDDGSKDDDDEQVVGWVHVDALDVEKLSHTAELTVGVVAKRRRQGIGRALLEHALDWAASVGYHKIYQALPATNDEAVAFLESAGWEREAVHAEHYLVDEEYVDEVLMATWFD